MTEQGFYSRPVPSRDDDALPPSSSLAEDLRQRGIDDPERLSTVASPEIIEAAVEAWDARTGVGPGLLAQWIRKGGAPGAKKKLNQQRPAVERWADTVCRLVDAPDAQVRSAVRALQKEHGYMPMVQAVRDRLKVPA